MSHLMLSRHGIWFYRKVYLTPRKRREIRISLLTRSKREALLRVGKISLLFVLPAGFMASIASNRGEAGRFQPLTVISLS